MPGENNTPTFEDVINTPNPTQGSTCDEEKNEDSGCKNGFCPIRPKQEENSQEAKEEEPFVLTRTLLELHANKIRLVETDAEKGLDLFCYMRCNDDDDRIVKECRGVVFHGDDIVIQSFNYTPEFTERDGEKLEELLKNNFNDCIFFDSHEGALLRIFHYDGKWFVSTHRRLDAFHSKWASKKSFGTMFVNALESEIMLNKEFAKFIEGEGDILDRFCAKLDPKRHYMFLVRNTVDNRIVCRAPKRPLVYHVGTFENPGNNLVFDSDLPMPVPRGHKFRNLDDMLDYVYNVDPAALQGIIVFAPNNLQYKVLNTEYSELFKIRGNEPSIKYRYLQIRMNQRERDQLWGLYQE